MIATDTATDPEQPHTSAVPAWGEATLARADELEHLCDWVQSRLSGDGTSPSAKPGVITKAVCGHLTAARSAANSVPPLRHPIRRLHRAPRIERAMSNLDAAEALLLNIAPAEYVLGQAPSLLNHVQRHLIPTDPRRQEFERIARELGLNTAANGSLQSSNGHQPTGLNREQLVERERGQIVTAVRAASSAALREQIRVRSFRNVLGGTTLVMMLLAVAVAAIGWWGPTLMPLCFAPEEAGDAMVVCPTAQSQPFDASAQPDADIAVDIDDAIAATATPRDLLIVEFVGLCAAAVAAASAVRGIRGTSERHAVPVLLTLLKLPTGALTAFLGLMLMRGRFVPGLSALDSSAQILAWALVFGYAQQLFTRLVDQQGHSVLGEVRGASRQRTSPVPP